MIKNIKLYTWYFAATSFLAWMPVFFMFFSERLSLSEVLKLEALYYIAVVILEVPSGYFSDRIGRKKTLVLGAVFLCSAIILYILGNNLLTLSLGQLFFAAHMAFISGTNTVFHYESLQELKLDEEYGEREAVVNKWGLISGALGALAGGWLGSYQLVYAYWLSLGAALLAFILTLLFTEPLTSSPKSKSLNFFNQFKTTFSYLKQPRLLWIVGLFTVMYVMVHVPYEFYQSILTILNEENLLVISTASSMSGLLYAAAMLIGALGAAYSIRLKNLVGTSSFLFLMYASIILIIGLMGYILHPLIVFVIMMRSFSWSAVKAPIYEIITPQIKSHHRATFYSVISLISRAGFFALLIILSFVNGDHNSATWESISFLLKICLLIGTIAIIPFILTNKYSRNS